MTVCPRCGGGGWICDEHPGRPSGHDGCVGPKHPCPLCNPPDQPQQPGDYLSYIAAIRRAAATEVAPDFEGIAQGVVDGTVGTSEIRAMVSPGLGPAIIDALRFVWNARGAADLAKVEHELAQQMGATASGPYAKSLDRALRALDR